MWLLKSRARGKTMKQLNVTFEDEEWDIIIAAKKDMNWREFILTLVKSKEG